MTNRTRDRPVFILSQYCISIVSTFRLAYCYLLPCFDGCSINKEHLTASASVRCWASDRRDVILLNVKSFRPLKGCKSTESSILPPLVRVIIGTTYSFRADLHHARHLRVLALSAVLCSVDVSLSCGNYCKTFFCSTVCLFVCLYVVRYPFVPDSLHFTRARTCWSPLLVARTIVLGSDGDQPRVKRMKRYFVSFILICTCCYQSDGRTARFVSHKNFYESEAMRKDS